MSDDPRPTQTSNASRWLLGGSLLSFAVILYLAVFGNQADEPDRWVGIVYPDRANLTEEDIYGEYPTLNECLDVVRPAAGVRGAYECGLNCTDAEWGGLTCERTVGNEH